jgi:hypothetical protein
LSRQLPPSLAARVKLLVARDKAQLLWDTRQKFSVDADVRTAAQHLLIYVDSTATPWEIPLGQIIPRTPHFNSKGDASHAGGGAFCPGLGFWFDIVWSPVVVRGVKELAPGTAGYVHINALEFIVVILQLAAIKERLGSLTPAVEVACFPDGIPDIPVGSGRPTTPSPSPGRIGQLPHPLKAKVWLPCMQSSFGLPASTPSVTT